MSDHDGETLIRCQRMWVVDKYHALNAERETRQKKRPMPLSDHDVSLVRRQPGVLKESLTVAWWLLQTSIEELTGSCKRLDRQDLWELPYKRIFFCTPQTFRNDIDRGEVCKLGCRADAGLLS